MIVGRIIAGMVLLLCVYIILPYLGSSFVVHVAAMVITPVVAYCVLMVDIKKRHTGVYSGGNSPCGTADCIRREINEHGTRRIHGECTCTKTTDDPFLTFSSRIDCTGDNVVVPVVAAPPAVAPVVAPVHVVVPVDTSNIGVAMGIIDAHQKAEEAARLAKRLAAEAAHREATGVAMGVMDAHRRAEEAAHLAAEEAAHRDATGVAMGVMNTHLRVEEAARLAKRLVAEEATNRRSVGVAMGIMDDHRRTAKEKADRLEAKRAAEEAAKRAAEEAAKRAAEEAAKRAAEEAAKRATIGVAMGIMDGHRRAEEKAAQLAAEKATRLAAEEAARLAAEKATRLAAEEAARLAAEEAARLEAAEREQKQKMSVAVAIGGQCKCNGDTWLCSVCNRWVWWAVLNTSNNPPIGENKLHTPVLSTIYASYCNLSAGHVGKEHTRALAGEDGKVFKAYCKYNGWQEFIKEMRRLLCVTTEPPKCACISYPSQKQIKDYGAAIYEEYGHFIDMIYLAFTKYSKNLYALDLFTFSITMDAYTIIHNPAGEDCINIYKTYIATICTSIPQGHQQKFKIANAINSYTLAITNDKAAIAKLYNIRKAIIRLKSCTVGNTGSIMHNPTRHTLTYLKNTYNVADVIDNINNILQSNTNPTLSDIFKKVPGTEHAERTEQLRQPANGHAKRTEQLRQTANEHATYPGIFPQPPFIYNGEKQTKFVVAKNNDSMKKLIGANTTSKKK